MIVRAAFIVALCLGATASTNPFCAGALLAQRQAAQQVPQMPPAGNPDHVEPPKGAYCDPSREPAHACARHAQCVEGDDGRITIQEDGAQCRACCYKKHCHCPEDNCQAPAAVE